MNHNPENLKEKTFVVLDKETSCKCVIYLEKFTPNRMFATISDSDGNSWEVMTNRLSKYDFDL